MTTKEIKDIAQKLQDAIDKELEIFNSLGKEAKALRQKLDETHAKMAEIALKFEPVSSIVDAQNPELEQLFEALRQQTKGSND